MTQLYGCIECGMLFAGWEYCLAHIEGCRPRYYLEVKDKKTFKEQCMIGHPKCAVPSYRPETNNQRHNNNNNQEQKRQPQQRQQQRQQPTPIETVFSGSTGETTLTTDLLNPVENNNTHDRMASAILQQMEGVRNLRELKQRMKEHQIFEEEDSYDDSHEQERMMMQLFDHNNKSPTTASSRRSSSRNRSMTPPAQKPPRPTPPSSASRMGSPAKRYQQQQHDSISSSRSPRGTATTNNNARKQAFVTEEFKRKSMHLVKKRLHRLIHEASSISGDQTEMLLLDYLPKVYETHYGNKLDYEMLGFLSLKELINAIPTVKVVVKQLHYGMEQEYLSYADPLKAAMFLDEDSLEDDTLSGNANDRYASSPRAAVMDKYNPNILSHAPPRRVDSSLQSSSEDDSDNDNPSRGRTPQNANNHGKNKFSFLHKKDSQSGSSEGIVAEPSRDGAEIPSVTESSVSSKDSSESIINAMAEMMPNTNAYKSILRVMSRNPEGTQLGMLMQRAPDFRKFLNHNTDRRCEARLALAHSVLQKCTGINYQMTSDGTLLYFVANPAKSTTSPRSNPSSPAKKQTAIGDLPEEAAKLFAASEFQAQSTNQRAKSPNRGTPKHKKPQARPKKLDKIAQENITPTTSGVMTPLKSTPQSAREKSIAESAKRFLAEAISLTNSPKPSSSGDNDDWDRSSGPKSNNNAQPGSTNIVYHSGSYSGDRDFLFRGETETSIAPSMDEDKYASVPNSQSSVTAEGNDKHSGGASSKKKKMAIQDSTSSDLEEGTGTTASPTESEEQSSDKLTDISKSNAGSPKRDEKEVIEKLAFGLFPSSDMHYKLLVKLAEHPEGMMWEEINALIPQFTTFVRETAQMYGIENIDAQEVLKKCLSIRHKQIDGLNLFFIHAPHVKARKRINTDELESVTSDITEDSSSDSDEPFDESSSPAKVPFAGADTMATLNFLRMLQKEYQDDSWPSTREQLVRFWVRLDSDNSSFNPNKQQFRTWLTRLREDISPDNGIKSTKEAMKIILRQLLRMKCLTWNNQDFKWDYEGIEQALDQPLPLRSDITSGGKKPIAFIASMEKLQKVRAEEPLFCKGFGEDSKELMSVAIMCEGGPRSQLHLVQVGTDKMTYIFDCVKLDSKLVCSVLAPLLSNEHVLKLFHGITETAAVFTKQGGLKDPIRGTLDTQVVMEFLTGDPDMSFNRMLRNLGVKSISASHAVTEQMKKNRDLLAVRPLPTGIYSYIADYVDQLNMTKKTLFELLQKDNKKKRVWKLLQSASDTRAEVAIHSGGKRQICYDAANSCVAASFELLKAIRPNDIVANGSLSVTSDASVLLEVLPGDIADTLSNNKSSQDQLSDIVMDLGRPAVAWIGEKRIELGQNRVVTEDDLTSMVQKLGNNRDLLEQHLHHISAVRNRKSDIIGLAMRVGRYVVGNAGMISDLLFADPSKSILFVGEPGSGKTTILREISRVLSSQSNVCIIDTSNEIAGDGNVPHASVGMARRLMVDSVDDQSNVMMQCLRSQKPDVMVIDELDRLAEVEAARTCKRRGVRMIAGAYGDLREIMHDQYLSELVGGVDGTSSNNKKTKAPCRTCPPIFDMIVELRRGAFNEWRVIKDTADAVDATLAEMPYPVQRRTRDPVSGSIHMEYEHL